MQLTEQEIDRSRFEERAGYKWRGEILEVFACANCAQIFVGVPDAHALLTDGGNPSTHVAYNQPQGTQCPRCGSVLQGEGQKTIDPSLEELKRSLWGWILRDALGRAETTA